MEITVDHDNQDEVTPCEATRDQLRRATSCAWEAAHAAVRDHPVRFGRRSTRATTEGPQSPGVRPASDGVL